MNQPVLRGRVSGAWTWLLRLGADRRGNIAIISALLTPVMVGAFGLGTEVATWYGNQRLMQNAADSAAIAAATNGGAGFAAEAAAVAARYGYVDGEDGVTLSAQEKAACPDGSANCYRVLVTKSQPLMLAQFAGFAGEVTMDGGPAKRLKALSVAIRANAPRPYCVLALAGSGAQGIRTNGAPKADLSGCNVMSNTTATCNGHNLKADHGDAHGRNDGCGIISNSDVPKLADPYAGLVANVPSNSCGSYPQAPDKKKDEPLPESNRLSGSMLWGGFVQKCGDIELTGPLIVNTGAEGAVLVIQNGRLDTNGYAIKTSAGSSLTIVFSGSGGGYEHTPVGGGVLDIKAPTTGPWKGVAVYQDPRLATGIDISEAGNSPTWKISGLVYLPRASVTFSGAVNKSSEGASCFVLVVDNLRVNGTGSILSNGQCAQAGLEMPVSQVPSRGKLVL